MMTGLRVSGAFIVLALLAACGGGGGSSPVQDPPAVTDGIPDGGSAPVGVNIEDDPVTQLFGGPDPVDEPVEESVLEQTLSDSEAPVAITGLALVTESGVRRIVLREGVIDPDTDIRTLNDAPLTLTSVIPGKFVESSAYVQADGPGIVGIPTDIAAMPDSGTATFTGGAAGLVIVGSGGVELRNGTSTVDVDFGAGRVSATMNDFTAVSLVSGTLGDDPFESMTLSDATLIDTGFVGGTLETTGGSSVDAIVGANATFEAQGQFYGVDSTGIAPAEVGGLIFTQGDAGTIFGSFIAQ